MKRYFFFFILITGMLLMACDKESHDFIRDNSAPTGNGAYPVSTNNLIDLPTNKNISAATNPVYMAGSLLKVELQFFSQSPVKEINLYSTVGSGAKTKVATLPYAPAYSETKRLDTLLVPYTVPAAGSGTVIKLDYEILNQNSFGVTRTGTIKVQ